MTAQIDCSDLVRIFSAEGVEVQALQGLTLRVEQGELLGGEVDVDRPRVLLEVAAALGAGDRDDVAVLGALREHPRERELGR